MGSYFLVLFFGYFDHFDQRDHFDERDHLDLFFTFYLL